MNASLASQGALAHCLHYLQHLTTKNGRQGMEICQMLGHFGFYRRCCVAGGERVPPALLGWYSTSRQYMWST